MNNVAHRTVKPSTLSNRGYAARRTPGQTAIAHVSTPKGVPQQRKMGAPSRVDVTPAAVTAGRSDLRLLSGDAFSVLLRD